MPAHPPKKGIDARVYELWESGTGRNAIASELQVSRRQVDNAAQRLGISFNSESIARLTEHRQHQAALEREELAEKWRKLALLELESALNDCNTAADRKTLATTAAIATDKDLALQQHFKEHGHNVEQEEAGNAFVELLQSVKQSIKSRNKDDE